MEQILLHQILRLVFLFLPLFCRLCFSFKKSAVPDSKLPDFTPFFQKTVLTDSEVLIEGTSDYTKQITSKSASGCLIKLNLTFFNKDSASERLIPINAITPIVGVPVIIYVILNRKKIFYFN